MSDFIAMLQGAAELLDWEYEIVYLPELKVYHVTLCDSKVIIINA